MFLDCDSLFDTGSVVVQCLMGVSLVFFVFAVSVAVVGLVVVVFVVAVVAEAVVVVAVLVVGATFSID